MTTCFRVHSTLFCSAGTGVNGVVFHFRAHSFMQVCSLPVHRRAIGFCVLALYAVPLLCLRFAAPCVALPNGPHCRRCPECGIGFEGPWVSAHRLRGLWCLQLLFLPVEFSPSGAGARASGTPQGCCPSALGRVDFLPWGSGLLWLPAPLLHPTCSGCQLRGSAGGLLISPGHLGQPLHAGVHEARWPGVSLRDPAVLTCLGNLRVSESQIHCWLLLCGPHPPSVVGRRKLN